MAISWNEKLFGFLLFGPCCVLDGLRCWFKLVYHIFWVGEGNFFLRRHLFSTLFCRRNIAPAAQAPCAHGHQGTLLSCLSPLRPLAELFETMAAYFPTLPYFKEFEIFKKVWKFKLLQSSKRVKTTNQTRNHPSPLFHKRGEKRDLLVDMKRGVPDCLRYGFVSVKSWTLEFYQNCEARDLGLENAAADFPEEKWVEFPSRMSYIKLNLTDGEKIFYWNNLGILIT